MTTYISNAFSLNMLGAVYQAEVRVERLSGAYGIPEDAVSVIGHADTAAVIGSVLRREVAFNRQSLTLEKGDTLYVAQYQGPRLPEGAKSLPEDANIEFYKITFGKRMSWRDYANEWNEMGGNVPDIW